MYAKHAGVCLETQGFPDAIHREGAFPTVVLRPGEQYRHVMQYQFFVAEEGAEGGGGGGGGGAQ